MPNIVGMPAILIILFASMILERLTQSWMTRASIKRGTAPDLAQVQAALFATWMFLPLTLIAFSFCLILARDGQLDWPAHAPETPEEFFVLMRDDHRFLAGLQSFLGIVLVYLAIQLMRFMSRITMLTSARSSGAKPGI